MRKIYILPLSHIYSETVHSCELDFDIEVMRKKIFIPPLMFVCRFMAQPQVPNFTAEEMYNMITAKDKMVSEVEKVERNYLTPKEYGIKKMGKRKGCYF